MELKCIAIDDEPLALDIIKEYVSRQAELKLLQTFDDAISGAEFLRSAAVDLLFIDVNMPDITGIDLVRSLAEKPMIIFTTAYKKFAVEGFELDAVDYLLKPISFGRFTKAVNKAVEYYKYRKFISKEEEGHIFVYSEYRLVKIALADIEYIESLEDYIRIHLINDKPVLTLMPLKKMLEKLPDDKFKRIHRSYIIQTAKVKSVLNRRVQLSSAELPVSSSYLGFIEEWKSGHK
ncbi:MAG: LytTR family DNA-binding domain-containing protein [Chitinophagaceae bacterium]|nr:LytTR family DNA-binding domain-containing protein [Chitinophagaceae bacterium]